MGTVLILPSISLSPRPMHSLKTFFRTASKHSLKGLGSAGGHSVAAMVACILHSLDWSLGEVSALASRPERVVINASEIPAMISPILEAGMRSGDPSILVQLKFYWGRSYHGKIIIRKGVFVWEDA